MVHFTIHSKQRERNMGRSHDKIKSPRSQPQDLPLASRYHSLHLITSYKSYDIMILSWEFIRPYTSWFNCPLNALTDTPGHVVQQSPGSFSMELPMEINLIYTFSVCMYVFVYVFMCVGCVPVCVHYECTGRGQGTPSHIVSP